ncbi:hypothetical protein U3516DRAFT_790562 [Neocallimastix sp. 'constans']
MVGLYSMKTKTVSLSSSLYGIMKFHNFFNFTFKSIKFDNFKEFSNINFHILINPLLNRKIERLNDVLILFDKALLNEANLSCNFFEFSMNMANFIHNRLPYQGIQNKISYEIFYNKPGTFNFFVFWIPHLFLCLERAMLKICVIVGIIMTEPISNCFTFISTLILSFNVTRRSSNAFSMIPIPTVIKTSTFFTIITIFNSIFYNFKFSFNMFRSKTTLGYSVFEYANNMKESFYYLIKYIKSINLSIIDLLKFISLFDNLIETYDLYDNVYNNKKDIDSEIAINHLKELYNDIYYYYDIKYKNLINSIEYENNISNIVSIKDLSNNDELYNYYLNNNIDAINDQDNEDNQNDEENNTENPDIQSAIYDGKNEKNSTETEYFNLNNEENNIIEVYDIKNNLVPISYNNIKNIYFYNTINYDSYGNIQNIDNEDFDNFLFKNSSISDIFEKIDELKRIEEENPINTYYYFNNNLYEEEQLLLELKLINKLNKILGKRNIPITDGNITNYLNSLLENIEKIKGYKYATMDDLMVIVNYLKSILINKRLSIINGENKAYNIEELFNAYKDLYNLVSNKIDINDYYTTSKLASLYLDFDLYEELNNSNYNDTLHLNSNIGIDNNKDFIMNYSYQSDKFIHKFITFLLNNYYYEKNYNISVITSELSKKLKSYKNEKIFSENLDNLTHFKEYENLLNRYVSYMDAYNKILTNIFEKKGKILFNGIHYDENLNKYLEIMYKYYQSLIYSDILESNIYSSDCSESFLGIKYYNCTKLLTNKEDTLKEIDLFDIISVGLNLNTYIVEKYKYWFSKYLMNIKPLRRNNNYIQYAYKLFSDEQLKDNLLDTIENALINFYSELTNKILNIKTIIINDNSSLKKYYKKINAFATKRKYSDAEIIFINSNLNYIGEIITININKNINNVIDHNTTEKKALIDYISIVEPIYNYIKEFSSPFNFENIKGIIESI